jgi:hypothetical protein
MKIGEWIFWFFIVSGLAFVSCGSSNKSSSETNDSTKVEQEVKIPYDTVLTSIAHIIAGLEPLDDVQVNAITQTPDWQTHKAEIKSLFEKAEEKNLKLMRNWAIAELNEGRDISSTLFYAFSGPDFLYANTFYPGAKKYVLFGLEPVGRVPNFDTTKSHKVFFEATRRSLKSSLMLNFFITKDMSGDLRTSEYNGVTSVIMLYAAYTGHKIKDMSYVYVQNDGKLKNCSYDSLKRVSLSKGVRFNLIDSLGMAQEVVYFSFNAENDPFNASSVKKYFENLDGKIFGMLKAASYLMHYDGFARMREVFLSKVTTLLTDDTGLAYRDIRKSFPKIQLYGKFTQPIESFDYINLSDLRKGYDSSNVKPIDFTYGYGFGQKLIIGRK